MTNSNPNQHGLTQNIRKRKLKEKEKKASAKERARIKEELRILELRKDPEKYVETYLLNYSENGTGDIKIIKHLLKWFELRQKKDTTITFLNSDE